MNIQGEKLSSGRNKFGLVTGNDVRCGVNTSFMPGVKVGRNVCIGAGLVIEEDLEDGVFVRGEVDLKKTINKIDVAKLKRSL